MKEWKSEESIRYNREWGKFNEFTYNANQIKIKTRKTAVQYEFAYVEGDGKREYE